MARTFRDIFELNDNFPKGHPRVYNGVHAPIDDAHARGQVRSLHRATERQADRTKKKWKAGGRDFRSITARGGQPNDNRAVSTPYDKEARRRFIERARRKDAD